jgi:hypothetical protein
MVKYNVENSILISNMISIDFCPRDKLQLSFQRTKSQMYSVLNYDKEFVCNDDLYVGLYRSVIFTFPNKKLLSYAPSKSTTYDCFKNICPYLNENISIMEHIDGIMIQLFYDERINGWEIATKNRVGGEEIYYYDKDKRTIRQIFIETMGGMHNDDILNLPFLEYFPHDCTFTFIIDTAYSERNQMQYLCYLIAVYCVKNDLPNSVKMIPDSCYLRWDCIESIKGLVQIPEKYTFNSYSDMLESIEYIHTPNKYVLIDMTNGIHCSVETNEYTVQKNILSQHPFEYYLFFCLNRIYTANEIYNLYPRYKNKLYAVKYNYEELITNIHHTYKDYYVYKKSLELPKLYRKHIENMHKSIYLPSIKTGNPEFITRSVVKKYIDTLTPNEMMYLFIR